MQLYIIARPIPRARTSYAAHSGPLEMPVGLPVAHGGGWVQECLFSLVCCLPHGIFCCVTFFCSVLGALLTANVILEFECIG